MLKFLFWFVVITAVIAVVTHTSWEDVAIVAGLVVVGGGIVLHCIGWLLMHPAPPAK